MNRNDFISLRSFKKIVKELKKHAAKTQNGMYVIKPLTNKNKAVNV